MREITFASTRAWESSANYLQRELIAEEVGETSRELRIWEATLVEHLGHGWNPKDVLMMLKNYKVMMDNVRAGVR